MRKDRINRRRRKRKENGQVGFKKYSYFISCMPTEITYEEMPVDGKSIDDERFIIDNTMSRMASSILGSILILVAICSGYYLGKAYLLDPEFDLILLLFVLYPPLFFGILGIKYLFNPIRRFTFHRLTGLVDVPQRGYKGWIGATNTVRFLDLEFVNAGWKSFYTSIDYPHAPFFFRPPLFHGYDGCKTTSEEVFAFLYWYMDKNRQLPPGKALDPYRMKDYLRREAEGFPEPLFGASIKIKIPDRRKKSDIFI